MSDLTFGVKLEGNSSSLVAETKSARDELVNLKKATDELAVSATHLAEGQMGMSVAESNAKDKAWALANGYKEVNGNLVKATAATKEAAHVNAGMTRELMVLGHEAVSGNFSRIPGSLMVLASRSGLAASGMIGMAAAIAAPVVALGTLAVAIHEGAKEFEEMNRALGMTSDYSGQTVNSLRALAVQMSETTQLTIGQSNDVVLHLAASGKIGAAAFNGVAAAVAAYAFASGESEAKVTPLMVKLFEDPAKGATELNKTMHFLNSTQLDHIATLEREGNLAAAQLALADALNEKLSGQTREVGWLEAAWVSAAKAGSGFWDALKGAGRKDTTDEQYDGLLKQLALLNDAFEGTYQKHEKIAAVEAQLAAIRAKRISDQRAAEQAAAAAEQRDYDTATLAIARQNSELWKTYLIKEQLARVTGGGSVPKPSDDAVTRDAAAALYKKAQSEQEKAQQKMLDNARQFDQQFNDIGKSTFEKYYERWVDFENKLVAAGAAGAKQRAAHEAGLAVALAKESAKNIATADKETEEKKVRLSARLESEREYFAQVAAAAGEFNSSAAARENKRFVDEMNAWSKRRAQARKNSDYSLKEEEDFQTARTQINEAHQERLMRSEQSVANFSKLLRKGDFTDAMDMAEKLTAGLATKSRAAFEINKAAALAKATVSGYHMIQAAAADGAEWGGYAGAIVEGALAVAYVAANLSAIKNTKFGGGGGVSAPSGGGIPSLATTPGTPVVPAQQSQQPVIVNIYNTGNLLSPDYVNNTIIPQLRNQISNADVLIIDPRSRQAAVLVG